jgi:hypothetical protein
VRHNPPLLRPPIRVRYLTLKSTVASDQWLTTQFDATWKVSEVKQYILAKVYSRVATTHDDLPSRERPVSPITFASASSPRNSFDDIEGSLEDDLILDSDVHPLEPIRQLRGRQPPASRVAPPTISSSPTEQSTAAHRPYHYPMLAFSTGQLLEDDYSLAWYRLRPHELLELHPPGTIVPLLRESMFDYIQPYLELDVRALRVVINDRDSPALGAVHGQDISPSKIRKAKDPAIESRAMGGGNGNGGGSSGQPSTRKRRKMKLEWRDRYLVIRQGILSLFKSRFVSRGFGCPRLFLC